MSLALQAGAVFDGAGLLGSAGVDRPEARPDAPPRWRDLFASAFPSYRRIPAFSKGLCLAAEAAGVRERAGPETAVVLATAFGCLDADVAFQESLAADAEVKPGLFPYTLPSTCLGELAILYGLTGPSLCLSAADPGAALDEAALLVASGEAEQVLFCAGEWVGPLASERTGVAAQASFHVGLLGPGPGLAPPSALASSASLRGVLEAQR